MGDGAETPAKIVGSTFAGRYRVVQLLRSGGIADVYLAEQLTLRPGPLAVRGAEPHDGAELLRAGRASRLALKVLREQFRADRAVIRRFERGIEAVARVVHPNVVRTGPPERLPNGLPFCTMELLIGLDLADMLAYGRKLDPARAVRIAQGAAAGLAAAHAAGVVHLDVKPENIFVVHEPDGSELVKILDFGLSSAAGEAARADAACGTPEYMAPEQQRDVPAAPTMDVYALGAVLFEMLTGHVPGAPDAGALAAPAWLAEVVERAIAPSPAARFPTMAAFLAALGGAA